jgi:hypothetical protein
MNVEDGKTPEYVPLDTLIVSPNTRLDDMLSLEINCLKAARYRASHDTDVQRTLAIALYRLLEQQCSRLLADGSSRLIDYSWSFVEMIKLLRCLDPVMGSPAPHRALEKVHQLRDKLQNSALQSWHRQCLVAVAYIYEAVCDSESGKSTSDSIRQAIDVWTDLLHNVPIFRVAMECADDTIIENVREKLDDVGVGKLYDELCMLFLCCG